MSAGGAGALGSRVTLRDVAREADVHPGTASRALNEATRPLVNTETADRVLAAAERLGYFPNPMARGLKTSRTWTVGVMIPDLNNPLFPPIVRGIQDRLEAAGYTPLIANTDNDAERERMSVGALVNRQVDGFLSATARFDAAALGLPESMPVVLVNRRTADERIPFAIGDDHQGIALAVRHLRELGHERIAHIAGPEQLSTAAMRREAFVEAIAAEGLEADPALIAETPALVESDGAAACERLLADGPEFTAVIAVNDLVALGCYDALERRGMSCPGDVSVVGFNDMPFIEHFRPPLTSIRIPHYELGAEAANLLLAKLDDPEAVLESKLLEASLVIRESTAPPRA
ncbi:LacI family DNA-binding transcriptional regulator [Thermoleophilia bacterium SCSIO 60948]|nr:LacI family DNA-binding transcriptional regulator [Thermoleophilia bacterium SCSIO 60948]